MKTNKLNLKDLKVQSFITSLENNDSQTIKGGSTAFCGIGAGAVAANVAAIGVGAVVALAAGVVVGAATYVAVDNATKKK